MVSWRRAAVAGIAVGQSQVREGECFPGAGVMAIRAGSREVKRRRVMAALAVVHPAVVEMDVFPAILFVTV